MAVPTEENVIKPDNGDNSHNSGNNDNDNTLTHADINVNDISFSSTSNNVRTMSPSIVRNIATTSPGFNLALTALDVGTVDDSNTFEEVMRERNRIRKEREEYHVAELKVQIKQLEQGIAAETKRRLDATTSIDGQARQLVKEMEDRLRKQLEEDNERIRSRLEVIESRLDNLEERWKTDSTAHVEQVQKQAATFKESLEDLQQQQEAERKARIRREGRLLQQVEGYSKEFEARWNHEREERIEQVCKLEQQLQLQHQSRAAEQDAFQNRVEHELKALQQDLLDEATERQVKDSQIVSALNRYTQQLQHSLSILSAD